MATLNNAWFNIIAGNSGPIVPIREGYIECGDLLLFDSATNKACAMKMSAYDSSLIGDRYKCAEAYFLHWEAGKAIFLTGSQSNAGIWSGSNNYFINIPNDGNGNAYSNGSFHYKTSSYTAVEGDVSWTSGDSISSIASQIITNSYVSRTSKIDGIDIYLYGTSEQNSIVLTNVVGDVTVEDRSMNTILPNGSPSSVHMSWGGSYASDIVDGVPHTTACYSNNGTNNSYRCGANYATFYSWASVNGNSSFAAESAVDIMRKTTFDSLESSAVASQKEVWDKYEALLADTEWKDDMESKYLVTMTTPYQAYVANHMADCDNVSAGCLSIYYGATSAEINKLAGVYYTKHDGTIVHPYIAIYNGMTLGSNSVITSLVSSGSADNIHLVTPLQFSSYMRDDHMKAINDSITMRGVGTNIPTGYAQWSCVEYSKTHVLFYSHSYGAVNYNLKISSYRYRSALSVFAN